MSGKVPDRDRHSKAICLTVKVSLRKWPVFAENRSPTRKFRSCALTTGLAPVEACLLARKRKTSHHRHHGACLHGALSRSTKTAPDRQHCSIGPGRGVDTNVMAPLWLINTRQPGQAESGGINRIGVRNERVLQRRPSQPLWPRVVRRPQ